MTMMTTIRCNLCGYSSHYLTNHLLEAHGMTEDQYEGETVSPALEAEYESRVKGKRRVAFDATQPVTATFAGVKLPVNLDVPAEACLPLPGAYSVPRYGKLGDAVSDVARFVSPEGMSSAPGVGSAIWVCGPPGCGKDAVFAALSARMRRPAMVFNITPDADIQGWLATRALGKEGTYWEEGDLLRALRDGYTTPDGRTVPYMIVLSDIDRATRSQMEPLRAILDSLGGRIPAANGMHKVLPGTLLVATANTSGSGDTSGKYTATPVDTSIRSRFARKVVFTNLDQRDEEPIVRSKFPALSARFPDLIPTVMRATRAIRDAVEKDEIYADFGHREVCAWVDAARVFAAFYPGKDSGKVIRAGLKVILADASNEDTREALKRLVDPHLKGGAIEEGDTSHISPDPLSAP